VPVKLLAAKSLSARILFRGTAFCKPHGPAVSMDGYKYDDFPRGRHPGSQCHHNTSCGGSFHSRTRSRRSRLSSGATGAAVALPRPCTEQRSVGRSSSLRHQQDGDSGSLFALVLVASGCCIGIIRIKEHRLVRQPIRHAMTSPLCNPPKTSAACSPKLVR
jgi:hypothetical protein